MSVNRHRRPVAAWLTAATRLPRWIDATALVALLAVAVCGWQGFHSASPGDWTTEARPSVDALLAGHLGRFFALAPVYGGSLLMRSPFMALSRLWGGGDLAVYDLGALPCLAAVASLLLWINADMRRRGCGAVARMATAIIGGFSPLAIIGLYDGHPEELLGATMCVAAVLCAQRNRAVCSGVLVGLAIANKDWGILAAGPVLVSLSDGRWRALIAMTATAGLLFAPFVLAHSGFVAQTEAVAIHTGTLFSPFQLWWSLGTQVTAGARIAPAWLGALGHTLPIAIAVPLTVIYAWRMRRAPARRRQDALLLMALLLLLRCALDPWDAAYYPVPFLTALLAWEATTCERPPFFAVLASLIGWLICDAAPAHLGAGLNTLAAGFALAVVPAVAMMARRLLGRRPVQADPIGRRSAATEIRAIQTRPWTLS